MRTAFFLSRNLIGDALYISPAWRVWYEQNKGRYDKIQLCTLNDHVKMLYKGMGVPCEVVTELDVDQSQYEFVHEFNVNDAFMNSDRNKCHVAESYAKLLNVELKSEPDMSHLRPTYWPPEIELDEMEKGLILVSMFSASCSSRQGNRPNKMLPWTKWKPILRWIANEFPGAKVRLLGAPTDQVPDFEFQLWKTIVPDLEYMRAVPLDRLAWIMRASLLTITVDNGMSHLAASQQAREFVLYPACLGTHYILPVGNQERMEYLQMDPNEISPAVIQFRLNKAKLKWKL